MRMTLTARLSRDHSAEASRGDGHHQPILEQTSGISLISGLMAHYGETGDAIAALRWALPKVLNELNAEAGSLFLYREEDNQLECVVCVGPVDVTGLVVPADQGLVGRAFTSGHAELFQMPAATRHITVPLMPRQGSRLLPPQQHLCIWGRCGSDRYRRSTGGPPMMPT